MDSARTPVKTDYLHKYDKSNLNLSRRTSRSNSKRKSTEKTFNYDNEMLCSNLLKSHKKMRNYVREASQSRTPSGHNSINKSKRSKNIGASELINTSSVPKNQGLFPEEKKLYESALNPLSGLKVKNPFKKANLVFDKFEPPIKQEHHLDQMSVMLKKYDEADIDLLNDQRRNGKNGYNEEDGGLSSGRFLNVFKKLLGVEAGHFTVVN